MHNKTTVTTKHYFKILNILFFALVAGQVLFAAVAIMQRYFSDQPIAAALPGDTRFVMLLLPLITLIALAASWLLFTTKLKSVKDKTELSDRLKAYRSAQITRYAVMEAPSLLAIVAFLLTGTYLFLACAIFIILSFLYIRPTPASLIAHLQLPYEDQLLIQDPQAVLYEDEWHIQ